MATVKKGVLKTSGLWRRHLRRRLKKRFWRGERQAARKLARREAEPPKA